MLIQFDTCKYLGNLHIFINDRNRTRMLLTWVLRCAHVNNTANPNRPKAHVSAENYEFGPGLHMVYAPPGHKIRVLARAYVSCYE